jgi:diacylglycerol O-acyltransferase / wax synthase
VMLQSGISGMTEWETNLVALDRPTPLDVSNLRIEKRGVPMNVAALAILEPGALLDASGQLGLDAIRDRIERRLYMAPRLRQRLHWPGLGLGPPVWVDDAAFDIRRHVRAHEVPAPGGEDALLASCVTLNDRPFDQAHPVWEIWLLTDSFDGRVAMLVRFHHVLADGLAALLLLGVLFDSAPDVPEREGPAWAPRPVPARSELLCDNVLGRIAAVRAGADRIGHPRQLLAQGRTLWREGVQLAREGRAPRTSFNRPIATGHRLALVRADLERAKEAAHAHHATVNDVVLSAMAGGARALLVARGELRPNLVLKVSVAASVRDPTSPSRSGNRVGVLLVPLPVGEADPIRRLEQIAQATAERKRLPPYQPASRLLVSLMIRGMNRQRTINLLMSNLPGPSQPMYFAGAKIVEVFQIGVIQGNVPLSVGVLSYAGQLNFDVVVDPNLVPDVAIFAKGMADDLNRLGEATGGSRRKPLTLVDSRRCTF